MSSYTDGPFSWDERKRQANLRKHGYDFADALEVFFGSTVTAEDEREAYGEQRFLTVGLLRETVVVVTHTERRGSIRVISIRKATRHEAQDYFSSLAD